MMLHSTSTYRWSIPVIVARIEIRLILELLLQREVVELLAEGELAVNGSLRNAVVDYVEETLGANDFNEGLRKLRVGFGRSVVLRQVDSRELGPVKWLLGLGNVSVLVGLGYGDGHFDDVGGYWS